MNDKNEKSPAAQTKKVSRTHKMLVLSWVRIAVQVVFFLTIPSWYSQAFGGLKATFTALGAGDVLAWSTFTTRLVFLLVITVIVGRFFCGWACAFGSFGDWVYLISKTIQQQTKKKLPPIPVKAQLVLQKMKYIVLVLVLAVCFFGHSNLVTQYSPWTIFSLFTARQFSMIAGYRISGAIMIAIIVGMAFQERFFCQFLCPMGAIFSLVPEFPLLALKRDPEKCIPKCQICKRNCPVSLKFDENQLVEGECIRCGRCKVNCPRQSIGLGIRRLGKKK